MRNDVTALVDDAVRLKRISQLDEDQTDEIGRTQLRSLRLLSRFYGYIGANWTITPGTQKVFEAARDRVSESLATDDEALASELKNANLLELAWRITKDGDWSDDVRTQAPATFLPGN